MKVMGAMKIMMVVAVVTAVITAAMGGEVYMVGDNVGWTSVANYDYKAWAASKLFKVGDTIVFRYVKIFHNVARVSYNDFLTCNGSNPYTISNSGNDSFSIKYPGHYFFICTEPDHCELGQKVDIRVPYAVEHSAPKPVSADSPAPIQPLPFPYPQPFVPSQSPPTPLVSQSPTPTSSREFPVPTPEVPAPEISPVQQKNVASLVGNGFKIWTMMMMVWFYLIGFSF
ncbi:hypothetical protein QVD17_17117 [Tagetes erecta]|uniref:Phytocyanin domain-containing protein n=1 Tax=Tagetes erecta TaxID=13708 RepID=A0AAD8KW79_TARER|nr:hypothetical protein QVD17_17117 [Tagetes erecta]